jgi:hypothetical protein
MLQTTGWTYSYDGGCILNHNNIVNIFIYSVKIIFKSMVGADIDQRKYDICRLSTSSSVEFERQPLTTVWVWYWKDQLGQWRKYGEVILIFYVYFNNCI